MNQDVARATGPPKSGRPERAGVPIGRSAFTSKNKSPEAMETAAAQSSARFQPKLVATNAVTIGENHPPKLPNVFIIPESEPVNSGVRSMHVAQNVLAANIFIPPPTANAITAAVLLTVFLPTQSNIAEEHIPPLTAALRPHRFPETSRREIGERDPPNGATLRSPNMELLPQRPVCVMLRWSTLY